MKLIMLQIALPLLLLLQLATATATAPAADPVTEAELAKVAEWGPKVTRAVSASYAARRDASPDKAQPTRFFHAKSHGGFRVKFKGRATGEGAGIFAAGHSTEAVVRFSSGSGDIQKDTVADLKGIAFKVDCSKMSAAGLGPRNELPGGDDAGDEHSQDFIGATGEAHPLRHAENEAGIVTSMAEKIVDKAKGERVGAALHGLGTVWGLAGAAGESVRPSFERMRWWNPLGLHARVKTNVDAAFKAADVKNLFQIKAWHSQTPYSYKGKLVRYAYEPYVVPADPNHPVKFHVDAKKHPHLASFVDRQLYEVSSNTHSTLYQPGIKSAGIRMYVRYPPAGVDVNDAQLVWKQARREHVADFEFDLNGVSSGPLPKEFVESLSFNPWRGFAAHRPLGGINRIRRDLYKHASHERVAGAYSCPFSAQGRQVMPLPPYPSTGGDVPANDRNRKFVSHHSESRLNP